MIFYSSAKLQYIDTPDVVLAEGNHILHSLHQASSINNRLRMACFSVRFCDNSLLVLKMRFQVISFASKRVEAFYSDRKIL